MLGGMAMKFRWRENAASHGLDVNARKPNLVISAGYQVCWEKFCVYWDIELRRVPMKWDRLSLDLEKVMDYVDEYTIGIVGIQGNTYWTISRGWIDWWRRTIRRRHIKYISMLTERPAACSPRFADPTGRGIFV